MLLIYAQMHKSDEVIFRITQSTALSILTPFLIDAAADL